MEKIPVFMPVIDQEMKNHLNDALDVGWTGIGAKPKNLKKELNQYNSLN